MNEEGVRAVRAIREKISNRQAVIDWVAECPRCQCRVAIEVSGGKGHDRSTPPPPYVCPTVNCQVPMNMHRKQ